MLIRAGSATADRMIEQQRSCDRGSIPAMLVRLALVASHECAETIAEKPLQDITCGLGKA
jgi:hypothetical protein